MTSAAGTTSFPATSPAELDELARETRIKLDDLNGERGTSLDSVHSGTTLATPVVEDLAEAWRRYVHIYYNMLHHQRLPTPDEVAEFESVGRRRLYQSFDLVELQRSFRNGARILLDLALERVSELEAGRVATLTLQFVDLMATAAERAYLEEQHSIDSLQSDSARRMLLRLLAGEIDASDPGLRDAEVPGYNLRATYTLLDFGQSRAAADAHPTHENVMEQFGHSLRSLLPSALQLTPDDGSQLLVLQGDVTSSLRSVVGGLLASVRIPSRVRVGIALPRAGIPGLLQSAREARRARLVGEILDASELLHSWEEIRRIDVFGDGDAVNALVNQAIGPLILHDARKGTQLVQTLAAFLDANGNRRTAASRLTVHINTLDYRLRHVQKLLDNPNLLSHTFTLHLAIRLFPLYDKSSLASDIQPV